VAQRLCLLSFRATGYATAASKRLQSSLATLWIALIWSRAWRSATMNGYVAIESLNRGDGAFHQVARKSPVRACIMTIERHAGYRLSLQSASRPLRQAELLSGMSTAFGYVRPFNASVEFCGRVLSLCMVWQLFVADATSQRFSSVSAVRDRMQPCHAVAYRLFGSHYFEVKDRFWRLAYLNICRIMCSSRGVCC
jgi:hypothetical protein